MIDLLGLSFSRVASMDCAFIASSRYSLIGSCNSVRVICQIIQVACLVENFLHVVHINLLLLVSAIFIGRIRVRVQRGVGADFIVFCVCRIMDLGDLWCGLSPLVVTILIEWSLDKPFIQVVKCITPIVLI